MRSSPSSCVAFALSLTINNYVSAPQIIELPSHLEVLDLNLPGPTHWGYVLPTSLKILNCSTAVDGSFLAKIPRSLEVLSTQVNCLSLQELLSLPRTLRVIRAESAREYSAGSETDITKMPGWKRLIELHVPFWRIFETPSTEIMRILQSEDDQ